MKMRPFHHQRPLVALAASYGLGVWAGVSFGCSIGWIFVGIGCSLGLCACLRILGKRWICGMMCAFLFLGMIFSHLAAHPSLPDAGKYQVTGIAAQDMAIREDGKAAGFLEQVKLENDQGVFSVDRVYWTYVPDANAPFLPLEGQRITFSGKVYHPRGQENPYGFDFRMYLLEHGAAVGVSGENDGKILDAPGRGYASALYAIRKQLSAKIRRIFGSASPLPEALLLGVREQLPEETKQRFSDAGVAHILSVSGLHVAMLAGALMTPLRKLLSPGKRWAILSVFLAIYCGLLEFSAPVVRASLLMSFVSLRRIVRRAHDQLTTLAAAFLLILLVRPLDLFSASFQLSFCAVLGIVMLQPILDRIFSFLPFRRMRDAWTISLSATAGIAIPTIQLYHQFSVIGLFINPAVCGIFGILLPVYALIFLAGCVYMPLGAALAYPVRFITDWIITGIKWLGNLPFSTIRVPFLPWYLVAALSLVLLFCTRYILWPGRRKALLAGVALILALGGWKLSGAQDVQYLQLAAGQADAALILNGDETILIDTGEYGGDLASYLLSTGRQANRVILTHLHSDHCMGLQKIMEEKIPIGMVYLPEGAFDAQVDPECLELIERVREEKIPIEYLSAGDCLDSGRVSIRVTWPISGKIRPGRNANRYPLALLCDLDGVRLFSASDIEGAFEKYAAEDADILKVSHHGSKNSTKDDFLKLVSVQAAIITSSPGSTTLPHADTLNRLAQSGISVYNTGEQGAITVVCRSGEAMISPYLKERKLP